MADIGNVTVRIRVKFGWWDRIKLRIYGWWIAREERRLRKKYPYRRDPQVWSPRDR